MCEKRKRIKFHGFGSACTTRSYCLKNGDKAVEMEKSSVWLLSWHKFSAIPSAMGLFSHTIGSLQNSNLVRLSSVFSMCATLVNVGFITCHFLFDPTFLFISNFHFIFSNQQWWLPPYSQIWNLQHFLLLYIYLVSFYFGMLPNNF